jgi:hypothetical protein
LARDPDILAAMPTIWPIIPPSVRAAFSSKADKNNLIPARVLDQQHLRVEREAAYKDRIYETALAIHDQLEAQPGWGDWPEDPVECLEIGLILGIWLELAIPELILEVPEDVLAQLEDECRERCVSLEFLIVDRMNAFRDAGVDPADWWKGGEA